jgi:hypothetical protein
MLGLGGAPMSEARAGQGRAANDARGGAAAAGSRGPALVPSDRPGGRPVGSLIFSGDPAHGAHLPKVLALEITAHTPQVVIGRKVSGILATPQLLGLGKVGSKKSQGQLVSRRHAVIELDAEGGGGALLVRDANTVNGTWVNGRRLDKGAIAAIKHDSTVAFGHSAVQYTVKLLDAAGDENPAESYHDDAATQAARGTASPGKGKRRPSHQPDQGAHHHAPPITERRGVHGCCPPAAKRARLPGSGGSLPPATAAAAAADTEGLRQLHDHDPSAAHLQPQPRPREEEGEEEEQEGGSASVPPAPSASATTCSSCGPQWMWQQQQQEDDGESTNSRSEDPGVAGPGPPPPPPPPPRGRQGGGRWRAFSTVASAALELAFEGAVPRCKLPGDEEWCVDLDEMLLLLPRRRDGGGGATSCTRRVRRQAQAQARCTEQDSAREDPAADDAVAPDQPAGAHEQDTASTSAGARGATEAVEPPMEETSDVHSNKVAGSSNHDAGGCSDSDQRQTDNLVDDFTCCVCRDPIALAASLPCGHTTWCVACTPGVWRCWP